MTEPSSLAPLVLWGAFALAFGFGFIANKTNFCTMGAVSDIVNMSDWGRMRQWLLAIAVAILGTQGLTAVGVIDINASFYVRGELAILSHLLGGALFGIGMVLASGCGSKTLVRVGGGNLKSLVVLLVMGIVAYMSLKGFLGVMRTHSLDKVVVNLGAAQDLPRLLSATSTAARLALASTVVLGLLVFVCWDPAFRRHRDGWLGGLAIGAMIVAGWFVSGKLGFGENPETLETVYFATNSRTIESFSFVAPIAYLLEYGMLFSDKSLRVTFGIVAVIGMIAGSAVYALFSKTFRWEGFANTEDTANHLVGAALMGFGGVTALGCTVGQGLTGISTLAVGAIISLLSIVGGAVIGFKYQIWRVERL